MTSGGRFVISPARNALHRMSHVGRMGTAWTLGFVLSWTLISSLSGAAQAEEPLLRLRGGDLNLRDLHSESAQSFSLPMFDTQLDASGISWVGTREKRPAQRASTKGLQVYVVQMRDTIKREDLKNLASLKVKVLRYLPDHALVISAAPKDAQVLSKSSPRIYALVPYQPWWKLAPELGTSSIFSGDPNVRALVRLFPGQTRIGKLPKTIKVLDNSGRSLVVEARRSVLYDLVKQSEVEWVEPLADLELPWFRDDYLRFGLLSTPGDYSDLTGFESGTKLMKLDAVWARGFRGQGEIAAFADTGFDRGDTQNVHQDVNGRIPQGFIHGLFSKSWEDPMGHGTHVGGSIGGDGAASATGIPGAAPLSQLIPQSMWSPMLDNLSVPSKLKDMFGKAQAAGARIHSNSWGAAAGFGNYDAMAQQVDEYMHQNPEFLLLFAAGNNGEDADKDGRIDGNSISSPGTAKNVLTVGASKNFVKNGGIQRKLIELKIGQEKWGVEPLASSMLSDNERGLAPFSSRGPTKDGRLKPEVVAPGTNILSLKSQHPKSDPLWGLYNSLYAWSGGTSMSTPLVAGAAAIVREYLRKERQLTQPSAALVKGILMHTSEDLFPGQFGAVGASRGQELLTERPNMDQGYGRVNAEQATRLETSMLIDEKKGLAVGEVHAYPIRLMKSARLTATLVYTDAPGAAGAAKALVNDLDLSLVSVSGPRVDRQDRANNHEFMSLQVNPGDYRLEVRGANVPMGQQPYALIVTAE